MLDRESARIGRFAWVMAWVGLVMGQLHALSRFATADGKAHFSPIRVIRKFTRPVFRFLEIISRN